MIEGAAVRIIPVLDLKGGQVVRASQGRRDLYQPIKTPLSPSADPFDVASGLRCLCAFPVFYCADLDAIEGLAPNVEALAKLKTLPNPPTLWVDAGLAADIAFDAALSDETIRPVLGTESQSDSDLLGKLRAHPRLVLSLDFFAEGYRGPQAILDHAELWPQTVIVMTLAKVGAAAGPDFERLYDVKSRAGDRTIVAAGGIRNEADLRSLSAMGVQAALMATALHDGTLTATQLANLGA